MDAETRAKRIQDEVEKTKALKADYVATFTSEHGRRVLEDLRKRGFFNKTLYAPGIDNIGLALREGQRTIVIHIDNMMNIDIEKLKNQMEGQKEE